MVFLPQFGRLLKTDKDSSDISDVVTERWDICVHLSSRHSGHRGRGRRIYKDWEVEGHPELHSKVLSQNAKIGTEKMVRWVKQLLCKQRKKTN